MDFVCSKDQVRQPAIQAPICIDCGQRMKLDELSYKDRKRTDNGLMLLEFTPGQGEPDAESVQD